MTAPTLKNGSYPINEPINHTGAYAVHNHRAGDGEHLCTDAQDEAFCVCQLRTHYFFTNGISVIRSFAQPYGMSSNFCSLEIGSVE